MPRNLRIKPLLSRRRLSWVVLLAATLLGAGLHRQETRAVEPRIDPASGNDVKLIIRDDRGLEIRVFSHSDLREAGVPVIKLENYEMDQTIGW